MFQPSLALWPAMRCTVVDLSAHQDSILTVSAASWCFVVLVEGEGSGKLVAASEVIFFPVGASIWIFGDPQHSCPVQPLGL